MKVFFFHPPVANITQPPLSIASLVAYLRQHEIHDISVFDLNVAAQEALLEPERLKRAYRWCYHQSPHAMSQYDDGPLGKMFRQLIMEALHNGESFDQTISLAKATMRGKNFYNPEDYLRAINYFLNAYCLLSARYFPTVLSYQSLSMRYRCDTSSDLLAAVIDKKENPFIEVLADAYDDIVDKCDIPDVAGISISYYEQLIPGLTLAKCIKERTPQTHVSVGGSMITALHGKTFTPAFFDMFDTAVFFEGEIPMLKLISTIERRDDLDTVPNACFRRNGSVVFTPKRVRVDDVDSLPAPSFNGLKTVHYMSPSPILPIAASRGCYWQRCTFCTRRHLQPGYRSRNLQRIADDLQHLSETVGARHFFFVDECISPAFMGRLSDEILRRGLDIRWSCYARFEKAFLNQELCRKLAASGLQMLYFGMESACQRILDLMQKGTPKAIFGDVLRNTAEAGIMNMILYFIGFPTETQDEALESMTFLLEHQDHVTYALAGRFMLEEQSPIYRAPEQFGISEITPLSKKADLTLIYNYKTNTGMTHEQIGQTQEYINERTSHLHSLQLLNRSHLLLLGKEHVDRQRAREKLWGLEGGIWPMRVCAPSSRAPT